MVSFKTKAGTELPLLDLKGKKYLQVAHRIQWFREEHPMGLIESSCVESNDKFVIYTASIFFWVGDKHIKIADSVKREDYSHFPDAHEKANTGAVGRALALCGYGTQFAHELEEGERIVDAPTPYRGPTLAAPIDPGSLVITFGKYTGKRIDQMGDTLEGWVSFMRQNKNLSGKALEAVQAAEAFLGK